jgi:dipeptidyl aminopeptidase/acylaminoacyl peptidase
VVAILLLVFSGAVGFASRPDGEAVAQLSGPGAVPKPFLLVEGWFDRAYVSDLYSFNMDGTLIKRLTSEPLPTNQLAAVAPERGDPFFIANASAFYGLSLSHNILISVHSANVRVPAISPDGNTAAFVIPQETRSGADTRAPRIEHAGDSAAPLLVRVMPVSARSSWRPTQFPLPADVDNPSEMTFTPDGEHVLITHWPSGRTARLLLVDLRSGASQAVLADDGLSYYEPTFAPDGTSLLAVREDLNAGRWSIVSIGWPAAKAPAVVLTAPRGVSLSTPIFLADGKRFLFDQEGSLARATLDGKTVEALVGNLDQRDRDWSSRESVFDRRRPTRAGWLPRVVTRYFARVEWREPGSLTADPAAVVTVVDVQTKGRTAIPMPSGQVRAAIVVE